MTIHHRSRPPPNAKGGRPRKDDRPVVTCAPATACNEKGPPARDYELIKLLETARSGAQKRLDCVRAFAMKVWTPDVIVAANRFEQACMRSVTYGRQGWHAALVLTWQALPLIAAIIIALTNRRPAILTHFPFVRNG